MKIIFMGTPDFAVAALAALVNAGCNIVAVVTATDKPAGRGQKMNESAVKKYAVENNLPVLQPEKLKNPAFIEQLRSYDADLQLVVAFRMLPEIVWNMPPKGTINLHGSLLPQYRGAAPINWAIMNGEKETGVTTFFLKHEIDTGDILFSQSVPIGINDTAGNLHDKLMSVGANLLVKTVKAVAEGDYKETPQEQFASGAAETPNELKHAPKIFKQDCQINWIQTAQTTYNMIRGLSPYPTAFTIFQDKTLKVFEAELQNTEPGIQAGGFLSDGKTFLKFACIDGFINLVEVQLEGKKRMKINEFLRGIRLE